MTGYGARLLDQHAAMLAASAVPPELARERGYVSVDTKTRLEPVGITKTGRRVPGLLIPLLRADGSTWGWQYRPDQPRANGDGKPIKYESPVGQRNGIDVPPGVGPRLGDPTVPLWITEGTKKADAAAALGLACVALPGVWSWRGRNALGGKTALPDWHDIALNGRRVILAFDSDVVVKKPVRNALDALAGYLGSKGATVEYLHLPDHGDGKTGLDDYVAAGHGVDELESLVRPEPPGVTLDSETYDPDGEPHHRRVVLTPASAIQPRRVRWLWDGRLALGTLGLLAGPEGLGKSTVGYWLAAEVTRGALPGEHHGQPKAVLVVAAEDSWAHTIVPRLMAAGADLDRVYRVEAVTSDDIRVPLTLPRDLAGVRGHAADTDAALLLLDPLISRLDDRLDTHRDGETRRALEPLAKLADDAGLAVLGLIHHNKSGSGDPLTLVMGSKAFTAVARSVHTVIKDPDDDTERGRLFGTPKNNLGRTDLPMLRFTIDGHVIHTDDGPASTGRLTWGGEAAGTIGDAVRRSGESADDRSATAEAADWLADWLTVQGGRAPSSDIKTAGAKAGHTVDSLKRARRRIGAETESVGFPRRTFWVLPKDPAQSEQPGPAQSEQPQSEHSRSKSGESPPTALTAPTGGQSVQSVQLEQSEGVLGDLLRLDAPTGWDWPENSVGSTLTPRKDTTA